MEELLELEPTRCSIWISGARRPRWSNRDGAEESRIQLLLPSGDSSTSSVPSSISAPGTVSPSRHRSRLSPRTSPHSRARRSLRRPSCRSHLCRSSPDEASAGPEATVQPLLPQQHPAEPSRTAPSRTVPRQLWNSPCEQFQSPPPLRRTPPTRQQLQQHQH